MSTKWFPLSRTLWLNGAAAFMGAELPGLAPEDAAALPIPPEFAGIAIPAINLALRFFKTHEGVGSRGKSPFVSWTVWFNAALVAFGASLLRGDLALIGSALVVYGLANIILRFRTDEGLRLIPFEFR
jgi:hypothetical protein